ncbi:MAG: FlgD immunoglobulin-like domain containing protein [Calditrichia bacterium]
MKLIYTLIGMFFFLMPGLLFANGDKKAGATGEMNSLTVRPLTNDADDNLNPFIVADGNGQAIAVWDQQKTATGFDLAAQLMEANANIAWDPAGVNVSNDAANQQSPVAVGDGAGGMISAFADDRSGGWQVYAMRMDASGAALWTANGVLVATTALTGPDVPIGIASDGAGGAIIVWELEFSTTDHDVYAQRIDASGNQLWGTEGVVVTSASDDERFPKVIGDGVGGAIVCWEDSRNDTTDVYANRLDPNGALMWTLADTAVSPAGGMIPQLRPSMALDANGNIVFSWSQEISATDWNIESVGRALDGTKVWGVFTDAALAFDDNIQLLQVADGTIFVWEANKVGGDKRIYAQKASLDGQFPLWGSTPVLVSDTTLGDPFAKPQIVSDGADGVIITYEREFNATDRDVWAQHINSSGVPQWSTSGGSRGIFISQGFHDEPNPTIASDGAGGAYIAWEDNRSGNWDIYGDRVDATGTLVGIEDDALSALPTGYQLQQNYPNPFNPTTEIRFATPRSAEVTLTVHNMLGQTVRTLVSGTVEAGNHTVSWNGKNNLGKAVTSGVYLYRLTAGSEVSAKKMMLIR